MKHFSKNILKTLSLFTVLTCSFLLNVSAMKKRKVQGEDATDKKHQQINVNNKSFNYTDNSIDNAIGLLENLSQLKEKNQKLVKSFLLSPEEQCKNILSIQRPNEIEENLSSHISNEENICPICMEKLNKIDILLKPVTCNHLICLNCAINKFNSLVKIGSNAQGDDIYSQDQNLSNQCPICKNSQLFSQEENIQSSGKFIIKPLDEQLLDNPEELKMALLNRIYLLSQAIIIQHQNNYVSLNRLHNDNNLFKFAILASKANINHIKNLISNPSKLKTLDFSQKIIFISTLKDKMITGADEIKRSGLWLMVNTLESDCEEFDLSKHKQPINLIVDTVKNMENSNNPTIITPNLLLGIKIIKKIKNTKNKTLKSNILNELIKVVKKHYRSNFQDVRINATCFMDELCKMLKYIHTEKLTNTKNLITKSIDAIILNYDLIQNPDIHKNVTILMHTLILNLNYIENKNSKENICKFFLEKIDRLINNFNCIEQDETKTEFLESINISDLLPSLVYNLITNFNEIPIEDLKIKALANVIILVSEIIILNQKSNLIENLFIKSMQYIDKIYSTKNLELEKQKITDQLQKLSQKKDCSPQVINCINTRPCRIIKGI